jgi:alpha-glucosidase
LKDIQAWWRQGVIYQIYPRSFADSNGDGIGDLNGIRSRLDHLADLGVDGLWLSPIFPSPDVDFGYDISDYQAIDPKFGTMAEFEDLLKEAHQRGLRVILDLVINHTSDQHTWFQEAKKSRSNPYHDWYLWRDAKPEGKKPNNWQSMTGGSGWEYVPEVEQSYFHMFYRQQPDLNWRNPEVRKAMLQVFRFWLDKGVDGYRLDLVNLYFKDSLFRDNPPKFGLRPFDMQKHVNDCDQPEMLPLLREMRRITDEKPGRYLVGEPFIAISPLDFLYSGTARTAAPYGRGDRLHGIFCFDFLHSGWNANRLRQAILEWDGALQEDGWPTYVLSNHDNPRPASRFTRDEEDAILKTAAVLLLTQRGTPFIYYGDEIGMRDTPIKRSQVKDPVGKLYWPVFKGRDGCRAPMQWTGEAQAGFTQGSDPWLPVHSDHQQRNVEKQSAEADSLLQLYKRIIRLRKENAVLVDGKIAFLDGLPASMLGYVRNSPGKAAMILINFSSTKNKVPIQTSAGQNWELLLSTKPRRADIRMDETFHLHGHEAVILLQKPHQR